MLVNIGKQNAAIIFGLYLNKSSLRESSVSFLGNIPDNKNITCIKGILYINFSTAENPVGETNKD
jgi:hypothetical protein